MQWNLINCLSLRNGKAGYTMQARVAGYATGGQWTAVSSFDNKEQGFVFTASHPEASLNDVRLIHVNASTDNGHEIEFDNTRGEHHQVIGGLVEGSFNGGGIVAAGHNKTLTISGPAIRGNGPDGIGIAGTLERLAIGPGMISANNQRGVGCNGITIGPTGVIATLSGVQVFEGPQIFSLWSNSSQVKGASTCFFDSFHIAS